MRAGERAVSSNRHDCDRWVTCGCGQRHWGANGAAGLLLWRIDEASGQIQVLLQHRAPRSHHGDTWGLPGGALTGAEDAVGGALREAEEEACIDARGVRVWATYRLSHPDWSYTTVIGQDRWQMEARVGDWESVALAWVGRNEIRTLPLLPAFAAALPHLERFICPLILLAPKSTCARLAGRELAGAPLGLPLTSLRPTLVSTPPAATHALWLATASMAAHAPAQALVVADSQLRPIG